MPQQTQRSFGWRDLLGAVNLLDFADMVGAELSQIGTSTDVAFQSLRRLPFGPITFAAAMLMVFVRSLLLAIVVLLFGGAILLISVVRVIARIFRRGRNESSAPDIDPAAPHEP